MLCLFDDFYTTKIFLLFSLNVFLFQVCVKTACRLRFRFIKLLTVFMPRTMRKSATPRKIHLPKIGQTIINELRDKCFMKRFKEIIGNLDFDIIRDRWLSVCEN